MDATARREVDERSAKRWLVRVDGEVVGPVSLEQLARGHAAGTLPADAHIADVDQRQWWSIEPEFWARLAEAPHRRSGVRPVATVPGVIPPPLPVPGLEPAQNDGGTSATHTLCGPGPRPVDDGSWATHTLCGPGPARPEPRPDAPPARAVGPTLARTEPSPADAFAEDPVDLPKVGILRALFG